MALALALLLLLGAALTAAFYVPTPLRGLPRPSVATILLALARGRLWRLMRADESRPSTTPMSLVWFGRWELQVHDPALLHELGRDPGVRKRVLPEGGLLRAFFGDCIGFVEGAAWRRQKAILAPAFQPEQVAALQPTFERCAAALVERLRAAEGRPVDVAPAMKEAALEALGLAAFGFDFGAHPAEAAVYEAAVREASRPHHFAFPRLVWLPLPCNRRARAKMAACDALVASLVERRRGARVEADAAVLLDLLLAGELSAEELRANVVQFLTGGHETTTGALCVSLFHLAQRPALQARARADPRVLERVVFEAMRLNAPGIGGPMREVAPGHVVTLAGRRLPPGTLIRYNLDRMHHSAEAFGADVMAFREDRPRSPALAPFGVGPRACIGRNFALAEIRAILRALLAAFSVSPSPSPGSTRLRLADGPIMRPEGLSLSFVPL